MKVYGCPASVNVPEFAPDESMDIYYNRCDAFCEQLKAVLKEQGYHGKLTGERFNLPYADGQAQYMVADNGKTLSLIHLPLGDAWSLPEYMTRGLRKTDVIAEVNRGKNMKQLFGKAPKI